MQHPLGQCELVCAQCQKVGHVLLRTAQVGLGAHGFERRRGAQCVAHGHTREVTHGIDPGVQVQAGQLQVQANAFVAHGQVLAQGFAHGNATAQHLGLLATEVAHIAERQHTAQAELEGVLQHPTLGQQ